MSALELISARDTSAERLSPAQGRAAWIEVVPGSPLRVPARTTSDWQVGPFSMSLKARWEVDKYQPWEVVVRRGEGGDSLLTGENLRKMPLQTCAERAARDIVGWPETVTGKELASLPGPKVEQLLFKQGFHVTPEWSSGSADAAASTVAAVYVFAAGLGMPPHVMLQKALALSKTEASTWVSVARGQKLLAEYRQGGRDVKGSHGRG